ncbi:hypothetical protein PUN4_360010 [Paraburkholderia unamae]|uniref:hypothetical protein n=1 Tax=Paraburkholderia unamae TaxID=219649 RepID=UPI001CB4CCD1|nr:hypothetical protein [Paraburkholderia unamae]CAG9260943.1 hypothetical protein PUN4_360010 [Paraburkholderia unamae]
MVRYKMGKPLTLEDVYQRLAASLEQEYRGDLDAMARDLDIQRRYLQLILRRGCPLPRWLLGRLGVVARRQTVFEYYAAS